MLSDARRTAALILLPLVSNGEVDEEEGHPGSFGVHFFPGEVVEGEGVGADAEQAQYADNRDPYHSRLIKT